MREVIVISCQFTALDTSFFQCAEMCLSTPEKHLFSTLKKSHRQQQFLAGHYLLRIGLTHLLGESHDFWDIDQKSGTAPVLINPPQNQQVYLSISHSKDQLVCAVSIGNPIGIDIENHCRDRPFIEFSEQYLSTQAVVRLKLMDEIERKAHFYALWTTMEAVAKVQGQGLNQAIFDGIWQSNWSLTESCELEHSISNNRKYFTSTACLGDFTLSIASKQPFAEELSISQLNSGNLCDLDIKFNGGYFLLDSIPIV